MATLNGTLTRSTATRAWAWRGSLLAGLWLLIAEGAASSWVIGLPSVAFATWLSLQLSPPARLAVRPGGAIRFVGFFLKESLLGGLDVARRTLAPELRIAPGIKAFDTKLPRGFHQLLFGSCVSLLPGTLSVTLKNDQLRMHLLDQQTDPVRSLRQLELRILEMIPVSAEYPHD